MAPTRLMTAEDLGRMPEDGYRYDLVHGELVRMAPAARRSGRIELTFGRHPGNVVAPRGLGEVYGAETGFILARGPDIGRTHDVAFVRSDRLTSDMDEDAFVPIPPDIAVEVVSPSDRSRDVQAKVRDYLDADVPLVLVIHPRHGTVTIHTPGNRTRVLREGDTLDGGDVLPGFRLPVAEIVR